MENNTPLLSVCLITYNHERFISKAIESVLMQKVNFSWEFIIADDFSIDNTRNIIKTYAECYPNLIKPVLQVKNVGAAQNWWDLINSSKGKYIAYLEGDDYWTDEYKLQKQIGFLESHPEYVMYFHNVFVYREDDEIYKPFNDKKNLVKIDLLYLINNDWIIPSCSMVFRNNAKALPDWILKVKHGDYALHLILAQKGEFHYNEETLAVYRIHENGISSKLHDKKSLNIIEILRYFNEHSNRIYSKYIYKKMSELYLTQALVEKHFKKKYFKFLIKSIYYNPLNIFLKVKTILKIILPTFIKGFLRKKS